MEFFEMFFNCHVVKIICQICHLLPDISQVVLTRSHATGHIYQITCHLSFLIIEFSTPFKFYVLKNIHKGYIPSFKNYVQYVFCYLLLCYFIREVFTKLASTLEMAKKKKLKIAGSCQKKTEKV